MNCFTRARGFEARLSIFCRVSANRESNRGTDPVRIEIPLISATENFTLKALIFSGYGDEQATACLRGGFERLVMFCLQNHQLRAVSEKFLSSPPKFGIQISAKNMVGAKRRRKTKKKPARGGRLTEIEYADVF